MYNGGFSDSRKPATGNGDDKPSPLATNDADQIEHCVHVIIKNLQSSGANHQGVGICISAKFAAQVTHMSFHAYWKRICSLHFSLISRRLRVFSCYFPTTWDADGAVEQMYDVLNLLVDACVEAGDVPMWAVISMHVLG